MIIDDLHIEGVAIFKAKAQPPTVIDANAPLAEPVMFQGFQSIGWRQVQILDASGGIQLREPHVSTPDNLGRETARHTRREKTFRLIIGERPDHRLNRKLIVYASQVDIPISMPRRRRHLRGAAPGPLARPAGQEHRQHQRADRGVEGQAVGSVEALHALAAG